MMHQNICGKKIYIFFSYFLSEQDMRQTLKCETHPDVAIGDVIRKTYNSVLECVEMVYTVRVHVFVH